MRVLLIGLFLFVCSSCSHKAANKEGQLMSMQIIDRNGFAETISSKDRLTPFENTDFDSAQPYQKIVRVFGKSSSGKQLSKITSYHPNGNLHQYLEVVNGRANGYFREWFPSGTKKIECYVIEGTPDINELAQVSWVFDETSFVWNEEGVLIAQIQYNKGALEGTSSYYHKNGQLEKTIPYHKNLIDGTLFVYRDDGQLLEQVTYNQGLKEGSALAYRKDHTLLYQEEYTQDRLISGSYFNSRGTLIASITDGMGKQALFKNDTLYSLIEYKKGIPEGKIEFFSPTGDLSSYHHILNGLKSGEEVEYYPSNTGSLIPKLSIQWNEDTIEGIVKTWYENGTLESQREISQNKKQGLSFAWYKDGSLMFMEEYDNDTLIAGSYLKKGDKKPASKVENGKGIATLYDSKGRFQKKIRYEKGLPHLDDNKR